MASVKINIPNIGEVEAVNAATEETLQKILTATLKSEKAKQAENAALVKAQKEQQKRIEDYNKSLEGLDDATKKQRVKEAERDARRAADTAKYGDMQVKAATAITSTFASLSKSALSLGVQMATMYDEMANNPIAAAQGNANTMIDMMATAAKGASSLGTGLLGMVPGLGGFAAGLDKAAQAAIDLAAQMAHIANDIMAKEFQKSADTLKDYTKSGASFAGGMMEMRTMANDAGLSMKTLSDAAKNSSADLRATGLSQGEATQILAKGAKEMAKQTGKSGASLQNEMLALGYSYQDQIEIQAQYMAQQRSAGANLKNIAPEELARGSREYAQNLKVISDITGQDAKKLMEKARVESMQAGVFAEVMKKGGPEALKKVQAQLATMPEGLKKAYLEKLSLGTVVDAASNVYLTANEKAAEQLEQQSKDIYDASVTQAEATKRTGMYSEQTGKYALENSEKVGALGKAAVAGVGGVAKETADLASGIIVEGTKRQEGATEASVKAAEAQAALAGTAGSTEQSYARITKATQDAAVTMEGLAGAHLDVYAKAVADAFTETVKAFKKGVEFITGKTSGGSNAPTATAETQALREQRGGAGAALINDQGMDFSAGSFAEGGIASGPDSGYLATLHGKEAIIPLDGLGQGSKVGSLADYTQASASKSMLDSLMTNMIEVQNNVSDDFKKEYNKLAEKVAAMEAANPSFAAQNGPIAATYSEGDLKAFLSGITDKLAEMHSEVMDKHDDMLGVSQKLLNVSM